jgi:hypothetical protein
MGTVLQSLWKRIRIRNAIFQACTGSLLFASKLRVYYESSGRKHTLMVIAQQHNGKHQLVEFPEQQVLAVYNLNLLDLARSRLN